VRVAHNLRSTVEVPRAPAANLGDRQVKPREVADDGTATTCLVRVVGDNTLRCRTARRPPTRGWVAAASRCFSTPFPGSDVRSRLLFDRQPMTHRIFCTLGRPDDAPNDDCAQTSEVCRYSRVRSAPHELQRCRSVRSPRVLNLCGEHAADVDTRCAACGRCDVPSDPSVGSWMRWAILCWAPSLI